MSIATDCMLVNLHRGAWEARKLDKEKSREVAADSGAAPDAVNVNKLIIPKEAMSKVNAASGAVYNHYILHTLPWKDNGDRLLSRKVYMKFIAEHEGLVHLLNAEADNFAFTVYPGYRAQAQFRMAGLFRVNDYPDPTEVRAKFYARMEIDAVTEASDFRVKVDAEQSQRIQAQIEANLNARVGEVMNKVWGQLSKALEHYAERMRADGRLYDSVRDNLIDLCDILPGLNILNDPNLAKLGKEIKARLAGYDVKMLRDPKVGKVLKEQAATQADEIIEQMRGFMTAFGVADAAE